MICRNPMRQKAICTEHSRKPLHGLVVAKSNVALRRILRRACLELVTLEHLSVQSRSRSEVVAPLVNGSGLGCSCHMCSIEPTVWSSFYEKSRKIARKIFEDLC